MQVNKHRAGSVPQFFFFFFLKANISIQRQTGSPDFYLKSPSTQPSRGAGANALEMEKKGKKREGKTEAEGRT